MPTNFYIDDFAKLVRTTATNLTGAQSQALIFTFIFDYLSEMNGDTNIMYPALMMKIPDQWINTGVGTEGDEKIQYTTEFFLFDTYEQADEQADIDTLSLRRAEKWGNLHRIYDRFIEVLLDRDNINAIVLAAPEQAITGEMGAFEHNDSLLAIKFTLLTRHPFGCPAEI